LIPGLESTIRARWDSVGTRNGREVLADIGFSDTLFRAAEKEVAAT
jgi:hypothetical protein